MFGTLKVRVAAVMICGFVVGGTVMAAEDWKGESDQRKAAVGALTGLGIIDGSGGFALLGTFSGKIVERGFVNDLNDSVSIEGELGPVFMSGYTPLRYSAHLRWDFNKDDTWTFYGLGGVGGNFISVGNNNRFEFMPRFGAGAFWKFRENVYLRGEVSHDLIAVGAVAPL